MLWLLFYIPWLRGECRVYFGIDINWYVKHSEYSICEVFIPISFYFIKFAGIQPTFDLFWFTIYIKNVIKIYWFYDEKWTDFIVYTARFIICQLCHKLEMTLFLLIANKPLLLNCKGEKLSAVQSIRFELFPTVFGLH